MRWTESETTRMEFSLSLRETGGDGSGKMGRIRKAILGLILKNENSNNDELELFDPLLSFLFWLLKDRKKSFLDLI